MHNGSRCESGSIYPVPDGAVGDDRVYGIYTVPDGAVGDDRVYGTFANQRILGSDCTIAVERIADNDPGVWDMLGHPCVMRGDSAIHISGLDPYGEQTGPGFIRAIGRITTTFVDPQVQAHPPSGNGCRGPEAGLIVTWDHDAAGNGHRSDLWQHHVFYSPADHWITLRGVFAWWLGRGGGPFSPHHVCVAIDAAQERTGCMVLAGAKQHEGAVRRLLDGHVGVQNNRLGTEEVLRATLIRHGRWTYTF